MAVSDADAAPITSGRLTQFPQLQANADKCGLIFRRIEIPMDGNCFVHAVNDQLQRLNLRITSVRELRQQVIEYLLNLPITDPLRDHATPMYIDGMKRDGAWVDSVYIQATSRLLKRNIVVVYSNEGSRTTGYVKTTFRYDTGSGTMDSPVSHSTCLLLGHFDNHFVSMDESPCDDGNSSRPNSSDIIDETPLASCMQQATAVKQTTTRGELYEPLKYAACSTNTDSSALHASSHEDDNATVSAGNLLEKSGAYIDPATVVIASDFDRVQLLTSGSLSSTYNFPKNASGRKYSLLWEKQYSWLRFSTSQCSAYCVVCKAFAHNIGFSAGDSLRGEFVTNGFVDWKNAMGDRRGILFSHQHSKRHQTATVLATNFLRVTQQKGPSVKEQVDSHHADQVQRNRAILSSILDVIIHLGRRTLPLRGTYDAAAHREDSNFQHFIEWKSQFDPVLREHITTVKRNASYLSPQIQNQLIECCRDEVICQIVERCSKSTFFSVMADKCQDVSVQSQLSVCVRYLQLASDNVTFEPVEDFVGFISGSS